jgi:hypothetical protein
MQIGSANPAVPVAAKLLAAIRGKDEKGTLTQFAERHGLDRYKLQKLIHGELLRVDVDFAFACQKATKGAVRAEDFCLSDESRSALKRQIARKRGRPSQRPTVRGRVESG